MKLKQKILVGQLLSVPTIGVVVACGASPQEKIKKQTETIFKAIKNLDQRFLDKIDKTKLPSEIKKVDVLDKIKRGLDLNENLLSLVTSANIKLHPTKTNLEITVSVAHLNRKINIGGFIKPLTKAEIETAKNKNVVKTLIQNLKATDFTKLNAAHNLSQITKQNIIEEIKKLSLYQILNEAQKELFSIQNIALQLKNGKLKLTITVFGLEKIITIGGPKVDYLKKIKLLITELKQIVNSQYEGTDYKNDPNAKAVLQVFQKHKVPIALEHGTSKRYSDIGNKYGNITIFLNNLVGQTFDQLNIQTLKDFASLFVADPQNDKFFNIPAIVSILKKAWGKEVPFAKVNTEDDKEASAFIQSTIASLIKEIKQAITTQYEGSNYPKDPNLQVAMPIFKKYGIVIKPRFGTAKKHFHIGNKYGNVTIFINNVLNKTIQELSQIQSIKNLASLFVADPQNDKFSNISIITKIFKKAWENDKINPIIKKVTNNTSSTSKKANAVTKRNQIIDSYYKNARSLIDDDDFWKIKNAPYSNQVTKGLGTTYYKDIEKDSAGKWNVQFNLEDWVNVYDTSFEEITSDPHHVYKPYQSGKGAPKSYRANSLGFFKIYNDKTAGKTRTGNNNNGLNGLYSGALFEAKRKENKYLKTFDLKTILGITREDVVLGLTKSKKILLNNGWEHVLPASMSSTVFGEKRKNPISDAFKYALGDLHNIRPSFLQFFNNPRSNNRFGVVPGDNHKYFGIDFEIGDSSFGLKVVEPRVSVRGDIARILFYMHNRYHIKYDLNYYKLLLLWARMDPVTSEELALDQKIKAVMGFSNPYVIGTKKLPYDQEVEAIIIKANNLKNPKLAVSYMPKRILWSQTPEHKKNAVIVDNPIHKLKVT